MDDTRFGGASQVQRLGSDRYSRQYCAAKQGEFCKVAVHGHHRLAFSLTQKVSYRVGAVYNPHSVFKCAAIRVSVTRRCGLVTNFDLPLFDCRRVYQYASPPLQVRLCFGYFARGGFSGWSRKEQDVEPQSLEITDTGKWRLRHGKKLDVVVDSLFPRPMRFREVWKKVQKLVQC